MRLWRNIYIPLAAISLGVCPHKADLGYNSNLFSFNGSKRAWNFKNGTL